MQWIVFYHVFLLCGYSVSDARIIHADDQRYAHRIRDTLIAQFQDTQPNFAAALKCDWHETVALFRVLKHFPDWQRTALRTMSLLEPVNRMLRRLFRPKGAFHSLTGLLQPPLGISVLFVSFECAYRQCHAT